MRRTLLPALVALALAAACGGGSDPAGPAGEPTTITLQAAGGEGELKALQEMVAAFQVSRPGVTVDFVGVPSQGDHIAKLSTAFAGGRPPDVFLLNYRRLGPFVDKGVLAPVDLGELEPAQFYPQPLEAFTYDGELACLPQNASSSVAYVNEKLFAKAGMPLPPPTWTWADLETAAKALHAKGIPAVGFEPGVRTVAPFVWSAGGELVDDTARPTRMTLDTAPGRKALEFLNGLQAYGVDAKARAATDPVDLFAQGRLAVFIDSRRSVPAFRKAEGLTFDVRPLPQVDATTPSRSLLASDAYCVATSTKAPELAADLARFAAGPEGGAVLAASGRTVPSLRELAEAPVFLDPAKPPRSSQVFLDIIPQLKRLPNVAAEDEAEEAADDLLAQYLGGRAGLDATVAAIGKDTFAVYGQPR
jgi:multiple sugar transport system substrate-binding protein